MYTLGKIFMRQGIALGHFLRDRVGRGELFHKPRHFPTQVTPLDI